MIINARIGVGGELTDVDSSKILPPNSPPPEAGFLIIDT